MLTPHFLPPGGSKKLLKRGQMTRAEIKDELQMWKHVRRGCVLYIVGKLGKDGDAVQSYKYGDRSIAYMSPAEVRELYKLAKGEIADLIAALTGNSARMKIDVVPGYGAEF